MSKIHIELSNLKKSYKQSNGSVTLFKNLNIILYLTVLKRQMDYRFDICP